jgi:hypothetical protein
MRKYLSLIVCLLFAASYSYATIRTVSNLPSTLAQFNTIQAAVNACNTGDTVYVHGSPTAYAAFTITDLQLVIIGPGWSPNKNLPFTANVPGITINGTASSNTEIQGLVITSTVNMNNAGHPNNLRFIRNQFTQFVSVQISEGSVTYSGYLFEGNVFQNSTVNATGSSNYQNFLFQNNYFYSNPCCINANIVGFFNSVNVLFNHNLWFGPSSASTDCFGSSCRFLTITNNIFVRRDASTSNSFSTFNNNITFNAVNNTPWASNSNVDAGGNVSNQSPVMVDQTAVNAGTDNPLNNFTIAAGPANNSGSDGKDIGLLFDVVGSLNWTTSRSSRLPFIFSMNIINPTIPVGGTLNVAVEARKNN